MQFFMVEVTQAQHLNTVPRRILLPPDKIIAYFVLRDIEGACTTGGGIPLRA